MPEWEIDENCLVFHPNKVMQMLNVSVKIEEHDNGCSWCISSGGGFVMGASNSRDDVRTDVTTTLRRMCLIV